MKLVDEQVLKQRTHKTKVGTGSHRQNRSERRLRLAAASRRRRPRSSHRRSPRAGWRPQLRHQPARSRHREASHRIDLQALRLRCCGQHCSDGAALTVTAGPPETGGNAPPTIDTSGKPGIFTPATLVDDSQVSIAYGDQVYEPRNYHEAFHGEVTARYALAMSLNNATVRVAQGVGFGTVAALAKAAGHHQRARHSRRSRWAPTMPVRWKCREPTPSSATAARVSRP